MPGIEIKAQHIHRAQGPQPGRRLEYRFDIFQKLEQWARCKIWKQIDAAFHDSAEPCLLEHFHQLAGTKAVLAGRTIGWG
jgi:hypothetical protein